MVALIAAWESWSSAASAYSGKFYGRLREKRARHKSPRQKPPQDPGFEKRGDQ